MIWVLFQAIYCEKMLKFCIDDTGISKTENGCQTLINKNIKARKTGKKLHTRGLRW